MNRNNSFLYSLQDTMSNQRVPLNTDNAYILQPGFYSWLTPVPSLLAGGNLAMIWDGVGPVAPTLNGPIAVTITPGGWNTGEALAPFAVSRPINVRALEACVLSWWPSTAGAMGGVSLPLMQRIAIADPGVFPVVSGPYILNVPMPGNGPWVARVRDLAFGAFDYTVEGAGCLARVGILVLYGDAEVIVYQGVVS